MYNLVEIEEAKKLASRFYPIVGQEIKGIKDFSTGIILAPKEDVEKILPSIFLDHTLYYRISEDENYYYAFYMLFHPFDWCTSPLSFVHNLDEHQFDTESVVFKIPKNENGAIFVISVFHTRFQYHKYEFGFQLGNYWRKIYVEPCGHGIIPWGKDAYTFESKPRLMVYNKAILINFDEYPNSWKRVKEIINNAGVNFVDQQSDHVLLHTCSFPGLSHYPGDMFLRPHVLFERAEKERLF